MTKIKGFTDKKANAITDAILHWFDQSGRKDLPWQQSAGSADAYSVWVSEIMLQQTQVSTAIPYFTKFMQRFPDIETLAQAPLDDVLHHWSGLGYYARARNLHKAANTIMTDFDGKFPQQFDQALNLPGIGRSTAGAILAFSYGQHHAILDGNVKRVLTRLLAVDTFPGKRETEEQLWGVAKQLTPAIGIEKYTQAIMDLGATVCVRGRAKCQICPITSFCTASKQGNPEAYPLKKPKKKRKPHRPMNLWLIQNQQGDILLKQRPPTGIWGGLWTLPEADTVNLLSEQLQLPALETAKWQEEAMFSHHFSHFSIGIFVKKCRISDKQNKTASKNINENGGLSWYNNNQAQQLGLPAPIIKILKKAL